MQTLNNQIAVQELYPILQQFQSKNIFMEIRTDDDYTSEFIYKKFTWCISNQEDLNRNEYILFGAYGEKEDTRIPVSKIVEITKADAKLIWNEVITITLESRVRISFCTAENPKKCAKCNKILDEENEQVWRIKQHGGYHSKYDNDEIIIEFCEDCLELFINDEDGEINE